MGTRTSLFRDGRVGRSLVTTAYLEEMMSQPFNGQRDTRWHRVDTGTDTGSAWPRKG